MWKKETRAWIAFVCEFEGISIKELSERTNIKQKRLKEIFKLRTPKHYEEVIISEELDYRSEYLFQPYTKFHKHESKK